MGRPPKPTPPRRPNPISRLKPIREPTPVLRQALRPVTSNRQLCPNKTCTAPKIEDGVCQNCGTIVDESNIVAEVSFGESASGAAVVQGSYLSADQGAAKSLGSSFRRTGGLDDRERTLREGKRLMQGYAGEHKISKAVVNSGMQIFKLAAMNNFIQGRRMNMVAAVCLYTACRKEKPCRVMLIDFADSCGVNVFKLGHCFKALHNKITVSKDGIMPVLPEDLIYRFATKLEFGVDTPKVAESAVRLVHRMSIDWMVMGRRPSGVCGACLILAARMHNFRRTLKEVVYIVKVTTATIQKRLDEFKYTASSDLTVEEFLSNQFLESAHDPPSFYTQSEVYLASKPKKRKRVLDLEEEEEESRAEILNARETSVASSLTPELDALPRVEYLRDADGFIIPPPPQPKEIPIDPSLLEDSEDPRALEYLAAKHGDKVADTETSPSSSPSKGKGKQQAPSEMDDEEWQADEAALESEISEMINDPHTIEHAKAFATAEQRARIHAMIAFANKPQKDVPMTSAIEEDEFANDPEVENCLLTEDEAAIKEQIWVNANKDWLRDQQQKLFKQKMAELGPPKATRRRIKKPRIGEGQLSAANSPAEAAVQVLKDRSWSRRINYDAIRGMFDDTGSAATSRVTSRAGSTVASSVAGVSVADESDAGTGSAAPSEVGNALLTELDDDEDDDDDDAGSDLDDNWRAELEHEDD